MGNSVGGVVPMLGADHPQLLVYSYGTKHIMLVNADTGAIDYETNLPILASGTVGFSGGSAYIAGAIPDTGRDGVWLATADGYYFFDRVTKSLTSKYSIAGPAQLAENLGGDVGGGYLFAPNYERGVQYVDLTKPDTSYYLGSTPFAAAFPSLYTPDGGAVDAGYKVGIVTDEDSSQVGLINMATIVKTDVSGGRNTFAIGTNGSKAINLGAATISGAAVDSDTHQVLFMAGYSTDIVVGQLDDPALGASWKGLSDWRTQRSVTGYNYARDPHAVAVIKNLGNGKSYGYLLNGSFDKSFQVDMSGILAAPSDGTTAKNLTTNPTTNGLIKTISFTSP